MPQNLEFSLQESESPIQTLKQAKDITINVSSCLDKIAIEEIWKIECIRE